MSNETKKVYVPNSSAKQVSFANGNSILKLSFKVEEFIAFLKANTNARGYVNLGVSARREVGKFGDTHCVWLDTWQPDPNRARQPRPTEAPLTSPAPEGKVVDDDVPF